MTTSHVFVCYSALSLDAAARIVSTLGGVNEEQLYFIVMFEGGVSALPAGAHIAVMNPPPQSFSEWTRPFAIARWFSKSLKEWNLKAEDAVAYIPHPFELPGNHFFLRAGRVELLPDGLINYYEHSLTPETLERAVRYRTRVGLRKLAARRFGLKYQAPAADHITQYESGRYARTWTDNPEGLLTVSGEIRPLPSRSCSDPSPHCLRSGRTLLVLDQELHSIFRPALEQEVRRALLAQACKLQADRVLYKSHPRGANRADQFKKAGLSVLDVSSEKLAEQLVTSHAVTDLLGYFSSPLLLSARDVDRRVAILPHESEPDVVRPERLRLIRGALQASGTVIVAPGDAQLGPIPALVRL